jgi:hypothetical protein
MAGRGTAASGDEMPTLPTGDFVSFVMAWNQSQRLEAPDLHMAMSGWLDRCWRSGERRMLLQVFRGAGKSTLVGLLCAWLLAVNPDHRILVLSADHALACKLTRNVRRIIDACDSLHALHGTRSGEWAADRFTVERGAVRRDPSLLARGVAGNITGARADVVICDDVEVPNTCDTALKREGLRETLGDLSFILVPEGQILYVGTPHSYYSIYAEDTRREVGEERPFLDGYARLTIPVAKGAQPAWPERFSSHAIERVRRESGPLLFRSQMMLEPVDPSAVRLDPDRLERYDGGLSVTAAMGDARWVIDGVPMYRAACWWDPALGRDERADSTVVAAMFEDGRGRLWLHEAAYLRSRAAAVGEPNELQQLCEQVCDFLIRNSISAIHVETNGQGETHRIMLRNACHHRGLKVAVLPEYNTRSKANRILEAFDPALESRRLHVHAGVWQTPLIEEMRGWRAQGRCRDDGLDAVAACIDLLPLRASAARGLGVEVPGR